MKTLNTEDQGMRLESALYSSQSGITAHGQAISVIGDNIANADTTGFKTSRAEFADVYADLQSTPATGQGVRVATVRTLHENGVSEATGRSLDAAISGKGYFLVGAADDFAYSRAGNFQLTANGELVNSNGEAVLGYAPNTTTLGAINVANLSSGGSATTAASIFGNLESQLPTGSLPTNPTSLDDVRKASSFSSEISGFDSLGVQHTYIVAFTKTGTNAWTAQAYIDGGDVGQTAGTPVQLGSNATLTFGTDGKIATTGAAAASITLNPAYSGGAAAGSITLDLSGMTQQAGSSGVNAINRDGRGAGQVENISIGRDGGVYGVTVDGTRILAGTLVLGSVVNVDGLTRSGSNSFAEGANAGNRTVGAAGTQGLGTIQEGFLERSTVDLAEQFVNLIVYQRGYQANSSALSTTSGLLKDTIGLLR